MAVMDFPSLVKGEEWLQYTAATQPGRRGKHNVFLNLTKILSRAGSNTGP